MENAQGALTEFEAFLKEQRISLSGGKLMHKGKRVGTVEASAEDCCRVFVFTQFDSFFRELLDTESKAVRDFAVSKITENNCPRCISGKCSVTGISLSMCDEAESELAKKLIVLRAAAIDDERVPKCNYIKAADRDKRIPCHKCKVCNPKCRAMRNF